MFSKNKKNTAQTTVPAAPAASPKTSDETTTPAKSAATALKPEIKPTTSAEKPSASIISSDLKIKGNIETSGDIKIEGQVQGNIRAHLLTIGDKAKIEGEIIADDAAIHGQLRGTLRGLKVRLASSARVEGDIIHKTISIESGAHFEGSVTRKDDPHSKKAPQDKA